MAEHTPLPWSWRAGDSVVNVGADGAPICKTSTKAYWQQHDETDLANAQFIVEACNSHYDLTARCERLREALKAYVDAEPLKPRLPKIYEQARAALSEGDG